MVVTAHFVDENWVLQKKVLSFSLMPPMVLKTGPGREPKKGVVPVLVVRPVVEPVTS
jgi:hypothetical protein